MLLLVCFFLLHPAHLVQYLLYQDRGHGANVGAVSHARICHDGGLMMAGRLGSTKQ
jgi:hypothetical protein